LLELLLSLRSLPIREKFLLVERRPLNYESHRPRRQTAGEDSEGTDTDQSDATPYSAWKCGGLWSSKNILMTMPKNRLISGTGGLLAQDREQLFGLLAGYLEVQGVRAEIDLVVPDQFAGRADPDLREDGIIVPAGEDAFAYQVRKVNRPGSSIVEGQCQAIGL